MINAKVKVSKEVAELVTKFDHRHSSIGVIEEIICADGYDESQKTQAINAFLNGYEVEKTPAEKVAHYYETERFLSKTTLGYERLISLGVVRGIEFVAKAYGLKIEGVNV